MNYENLHKLIEGNLSEKQPIYLRFFASFHSKGQTAPISGCGKFAASNCQGV